MQNKGTGMTLIVKTITRLTVGLILIYGIYIVLEGHISPGGGFAGGVIIALSFIHLMLAFGKDAVIKKIEERRGIALGSLAAVVLLFLATIGFLKTRPPSQVSGGDFKLFGAGMIPFYEIAIAAMVGTVLFVVFLSLVSLNGVKKE